MPCHVLGLRGLVFICATARWLTGQITMTNLCVPSRVRAAVCGSMLKNVDVQAAGAVRTTLMMLSHVAATQPQLQGLSEKSIKVGAAACMSNVQAHASAKLHVALGLPLA